VLSIKGLYLVAVRMPSRNPAKIDSRFQTADGILRSR